MQDDADTERGAASEEAQGNERRPAPKKNVVFGPFRFDTQGPRLSRDGTEVRLGPKPLGVLACLLEQPGEVITKPQLMDAVWGDTAVTEHSLVQAVKALRSALGDDPDEPIYVETAPWRGYRFIAPVVVNGAAANGDEALAGGPVIDPSIATSEGLASAPSTARWWGRAALVAIGLAGGVLLTTFLTEERAVAPATFEIKFEARELLNSSSRQVADLSRDGLNLLTRGVSQIEPESGALFLRRIGDLAVQEITGTYGAGGFSFSPEGDQIVYEKWPRGGLWRLPILGGTPESLLDDPDASQPYWGDDGRIVYERAGVNVERPGIWRVSPGGGEREQLTRVDRDAGEGWHRNPVTLPNGAGVLFSVDGQVAVVDLGDLSVHRLFPGTSPRYTATGHIVFGRDGGLVAVPFDQDQLQVTGEAVRLLDEVVTDNQDNTHYAVSETGTLVYAPGSFPVSRHLPAFIDHTGALAPIFDEPGDFFEVSAAPTGSLIALVKATDSGGHDIWTVDVDAPSPLRLTFDGESTSPLFSPDGNRLAFYRPSGIHIMSAYGGDAGTLLAEVGSVPVDWSSRDVIAFVTGWDIWLVPVSGDEAGVPRPWREAPFGQSNPRFSPDGRFLAYTSRETDRWELWVGEVANYDHRAKVTTSPHHVDSPFWSPDGRTIYFRTRGGRGVEDSGPEFWAVQVETDPEIRVVREAELLFEVRGQTPPLGVMPDGARFLGTDSFTEGAIPDGLVVIQNWFAQLKRRVSSGR